MNETARSVEANEDGTCTVVVAGVERGIQVTVTVAQMSGDWRVTECSARANDGQALTTYVLRSIPYGRVFELAEQAARSAGRRPKTVSGVMIPASFKSDKRGAKAARTDEDYARLAEAYLTIPRERRSKATRLFSDRHGGSTKTWGNRIAECRRRGMLTRDEEGEDSITDKALLLIHGMTGQQLSDLDSQLDEQLDTFEKIRRIAEGRFHENEKRSYKLKGIPLEFVQERARETLERDYPTWLNPPSTE